MMRMLGMVVSALVAVGAASHGATKPPRGGRVAVLIADSRACPQPGAPASILPALVRAAGVPVRVACGPLDAKAQAAALLAGDPRTVVAAGSLAPPALGETSRGGATRIVATKATSAAIRAAVVGAQRRRGGPPKRW
jgi:hypothetical protein